MINEELKKLLIKSKKTYNSTYYKELVDMVIETSDINYEDKTKTTLLLFLSSVLPLTSLIERLLENGAKINYQGYDGSTSLMDATKFNREDKVKVLLKYNPDLSLKNDMGETAYDIACRLNHSRIAELILFKKMEYDNQEIENKNISVLTDEQVKRLKMAISR